MALEHTPYPVAPAWLACGCGCNRVDAASKGELFFDSFIVFRAC